MTEKIVLNDFFGFSIYANGSEATGFKKFIFKEEMLFFSF
jgi:hypothetical protein